MLKSAIALSAALIVTAGADAGFVFVGGDPSGSTGVTVANARYRVSNTNWDSYIGWNNNPGSGSIVEQAGIGNNNSLNGRTFDFDLSYESGSGFTWTISDAATSRTVSWTSPADGGAEDPTESFNTFQLWAIGNTRNNVAEARTEVFDIAFNAPGTTQVGSFIDLDARRTATINTGVSNQWVFSDIDLSTIDWSITGKVRASFVLEAGASSAGNLDERLAFNITTYDLTQGPLIPAPGAAVVFGAAGLFAARRRR